MLMKAMIYCVILTQMVTIGNNIEFSHFIVI